jgi:integrase/recombinase XerD
MLGMLVYQGLKTAELGKLETSDINLREGKLTVPGSTKSNGREMILEAHQIMDVYDYTLQVRPLLMQMKPKRRSQTKQETDKLFIGEGGSCYSFSNFMTQLMLTIRKTKASVLNAKQIRASVITKWLKTHNLREVQYMAGHRYISSTESYLHNDMEGLKEEVQQFHPLG